MSKYNEYIFWTEEMNEAFADLEAIEQKPYTTLCCPMMVEVIAEK